MTLPVTASMLYDVVACPHRVTMDLWGDPSERDKPNVFVELLWKRGSTYEKELIANLREPFLDLSSFTGDDKERRTSEAMKHGELLIYSGRIQAEGLLGEPDLLRRQESGGYVAGDIKSGSGEEGRDEASKPKIHYAVQLGLYTDILERKGVGAGRRAFVWDVHGKEVTYDFETPYGKRTPRTLWEDYEEALREVQSILTKELTTPPAFAAVCKLCHWYTSCVDQVKRADDLTMIPELGRSKRDAMHGVVNTVAQLASTDPESLASGKRSVFPGIGLDSLRKFHDRAMLLTSKDAIAYTRTSIVFPNCERELFFDIEVDPMRDICYLHGFVERLNRDNGNERYWFAFSEAPTPAAERKAFEEAWTYIHDSQPCAIYYYSKYERTLYRALQAKYPDICSADDVESLFDPANAIDLYADVVTKFTEWPTWDYSIKTLAKHLGFSWRDTHPSGAASIEWFHRWIDSADPAIRQRILDYNEDDCRATRVLRDALENLPVLKGATE